MKGRAAVSSRMTKPEMPRTASRLALTMIGEPNQSLRWPSSSTKVRAGSPVAIRPMPIQSPFKSSPQRAGTDSKAPSWIAAASGPKIRFR